MRRAATLSGISLPGIDTSSASRAASFARAAEQRLRARGFGATDVDTRDTAASSSSSGSGVLYLGLAAAAVLAALVIK